MGITKRSLMRCLAGTAFGSSFGGVASARHLEQPAEPAIGLSHLQTFVDEETYAAVGGSRRLAELAIVEVSPVVRGSLGAWGGTYVLGPRTYLELSTLKGMPDWIGDERAEINFGSDAEGLVARLAPGLAGYGVASSADAEGDDPVFVVLERKNPPPKGLDRREASIGAGIYEYTRAYFDRAIKRRRVPPAAYPGDVSRARLNARPGRAPGVLGDMIGARVIAPMSFARELEWLAASGIGVKRAGDLAWLKAPPTTVRVELADAPTDPAAANPFGLVEASYTLTNAPRFAETLTLGSSRLRLEPSGVGRWTFDPASISADIVSAQARAKAATP